MFGAKHCVAEMPPLTFFDHSVSEEAGDDGRRKCAVAQQDAGQHGQLGLLWLAEGLQEEQELHREAHNCEDRHILLIYFNVKF